MFYYSSSFYRFTECQPFLNCCFALLSIAQFFHKQDRKCAKIQDLLRFEKNCPTLFYIRIGFNFFLFQWTKPKQCTYMRSFEHSFLFNFKTVSQSLVYFCFLYKRAPRLSHYHFFWQILKYFLEFKTNKKFTYP